MAQGSQHQRRDTVTPAQRSSIEASITDALLGVDADLLEIEARRGVLKVSLENSTNLSMDEVAEASKRISEALDHVHGIPFLDAPYELEVSSAGIERPLRTPAHFSRFVGSLIDLTFTTESSGEGVRKERVRLLDATDAAITVRVETVTVPTGSAKGRPKSTKTPASPTLEVPLAVIVSARTVFEWPTGGVASVEKVAFDDDTQLDDGEMVSITEENGGE